jgi:hypothetical protein
MTINNPILSGRYFSYTDRNLDTILFDVIKEAFLFDVRFGIKIKAVLLKNVILNNRGYWNIYGVGAVVTSQPSAASSCERVSLASAVFDGRLVVDDISYFTWASGSICGGSAGKPGRRLLVISFTEYANSLGNLFEIAHK